MQHVENANEYRIYTHITINVIHTEKTLLKDLILGKSVLSTYKYFECYKSKSEAFSSNSIFSSISPLATSSSSNRLVQGLSPSLNKSFSDNLAAPRKSGGEEGC